MNVLIVGGDPTASELASLLLEEKHQVRLVEDRRDILAQLHSELPTEVIYEDKATDLKVLEDAGIRKADVLVACTSNDADNLALCYVASSRYDVPRTIGRVNNPRHSWLFNGKLHVDVGLSQSSILAHLIEEEMSLGDMMTLLKLRRGQHSLVEVVVPHGAKAAGASIRDLPIPEQCVIVAIIRKGEMILPRGPTTIEVGDEILAITHAAASDQLAELFTPPNY